VLNYDSLRRSPDGTFGSYPDHEKSSARSDQTHSIEKERNPNYLTLQAAITKKRKRSAQIATREGFGKEAQDMRVPSKANYVSKKVSLASVIPLLHNSAEEDCSFGNSIRWII